MATSGSTNLNYTRTQLMDIGLKELGILRAGETVTTDSNMESDCSIILNMMLKAFQNHGLQLWTRKQTSKALTDSDGTYTASPTGDVAIDVPIRIVDAFIRDSNSKDTPIRIITRTDYDRLSDKTSEGKPNQLFYDYQRTQGTIYLWPEPDVSTYTLYFTYVKPYDDMDSASDDFEFPASWYEAIKYNFMIRVASLYARPLDQLHVMLATKSLEDAENGLAEEGSIYLVPRRRR